MKTFTVPMLLIAVVMMLVGAGTSEAAVTPAPAFAVRSETVPTDISPSAGGDILLLVTNDGGAAIAGQPVTVTDVLPPGLTVAGVETELKPVAFPGSQPIGCATAGSTITCTYGGALPGDNTAGLDIEIEVAPEAGVVGTLTPANKVTVSGGGASTVSVANAVTVSAEEPAFGFDGPFGAGLLDAGGAIDTQAADHPNIGATEFVVNTKLGGAHENAGVPTVKPAQDIKDVSVALPPGLVGDPRAAATCPQYLLAPPGNGVGCPLSSVVGAVANVVSKPEWELSGPVTGSEETKPIFNVTPEHGHPAQFAFILSNQEATLYPSLVHTAAGYVVDVTSLGLPRFVLVSAVKLTFFGDPAAVDGGSLAPTAFFTDPADCAGAPLQTTIHMDSWQNPASLPLNGDGSPNIAAVNFAEPQWQTAVSEAPAPTGCDKLRFNPEIEASPTTHRSGSPSGLNVDLKIPQNSDPTGLATPDLKNVTVALPKGLSISPSSANGLQACSDEQFAEASTEPSTCPEASQVGTVMVHTPILANPVRGQVFVGAPECGPCTSADAQSGRMIRLFIQVHSDEYGLTIKIPGTVSLDPATGQLTATFQNLIQQPFDNLEFDFKSGERAPLSTPTACGSYAGTVDLTPWSTPYTKDAVLNPGFEISEGCGARGFTPAFTAGTLSPQAGAYSPFTLSFARSDSEQDFKALEATLPPGLLAKLAGVPRCGEAEANAGTCPESARIGSVTVSAGPGADPYYVTGQIYLTGPYNGGPFGETVEVPAVAGPFNLGTVVVRGSIRVNPTTAQASVVSNPFPSILDGIPLQERSVNVTLDRPGFTFNPTSCGAMAVTGKLVSTQGAGAGVSTPFQAVNCGSLAFKPVLSASTAGRASKAGGASLDVKVAYPSGPLGTYANIKSVKVDLPKQLPSRLTTLQKACLAATFEADPASCPAASDVGTATATTPLLNVPVSGPAYLVSHGGEAFPDLELVLQGEGVTLVLVGNTDIKKGITSSTFKAIPDAPVSGFELKVPTGKYSVLATDLPEAAKYTLCGQSLSMPTAITAQNGAVIKQNTKIAVTGCPKSKKAKAAKKPRKASKSNRRGQS